jgi:Cu-Zn family superoxide dismutase
MTTNIAFVLLLIASLSLVIYSASANPMAGAKAVAADTVDGAEEAHDAARKNNEIEVPDDADRIGGDASMTGDAQGGAEEAHDAARKHREIDGHDHGQEHDHAHVDGHKHDGDKKKMAAGACCMACDGSLMINSAVAVLTPTAGNSASGVVDLQQVDGGVKISATVSGLTPNGKHAIHIHETGDVSSDDGSAAGGHYNPAGHDHALADTVEGHAGDLGNLEADDQGNADFSFVAKGITLAGMENPVLGRSIIVHAEADDGGQPVGNAGARISQGVIGIAE